VSDRADRIAPGWLLPAANMAFAAFLGVLMIRSALSPLAVRDLTAPFPASVAIAVLPAAAVGARRLVPLPALGLAVAASAASYLIGIERDSFATVGLVLYIVAATRRPRVSAAAVALTSLATTGLVLLAGPPAASLSAVPGWWRLAGVAITALAFQFTGWALGLAVYRQRGYVAALRAQAEEQIRAERERSQRALAEERLRIARELHDVVAHAMSVITVQAGVARHVLDVCPGQTGQALEAIETTGRQALHDMRQLLGVLRPGPESPGPESPPSAAPPAPAPGLDDLGDLITRADAAGTAVELTVRGAPRSLPAAVELSAYRIVQEALTNVVKHAGTDHARVVVTYNPGQLAIEVVDDGAGPGAASPAGGGHGLAGMRERALLHGGSLTAGPLPVRGFRVAACLPVAAW
jgi:signal transduction histidine kinase